MLFDFERFTVSVKLAYRRIEGCTYCLEDVLRVFRYYFETYEYIFSIAHPVISIDQIARIIDKMPMIYNTNIEVSPDDYKAMIDQHFNTAYQNCDYNINHFFSGLIREMRYYETNR